MFKYVQARWKVQGLVLFVKQVFVSSIMKIIWKQYHKQRCIRKLQTQILHWYLHARKKCGCHSVSQINMRKIFQCVTYKGISTLETVKVEAQKIVLKVLLDFQAQNELKKLIVIFTKRLKNLQRHV